MTLLNMLRRWMAIRAKRREIVKLRETRAWLAENVSYGQVRLHQVDKELHRAEAQLAVLEPADEIVRRLGAGA